MTEHGMAHPLDAITIGAAPLERARHRFDNCGAVVGRASADEARDSAH
jgi:hypothetical protein